MLIHRTNLLEAIINTFEKLKRRCFYLDAPKTLEKDNHKLLTFLGVFIAFIVVTFILYMLGSKMKVQYMSS